MFAILYRARHLRFFFQLVIISWMVTLSSCLIRQTISFILPPNEYDCVYACTMLGNIATDDLQKMPILTKKKSSFQTKLNCKKQNCRTWGTENPHAYIRKPTHPKQVTVWCGFWSRRIIGPFFFENEQGEIVTVNGDHYRAMLNEFLFSKIEEENIGNIWFQQDGVMCHTAEATLDALRPVFENRIISRRADVGR